MSWLLVTTLLYGIVPAQISGSHNRQTLVYVLMAEAIGERVSSLLPSPFLNVSYLSPLH